MSVSHKCPVLATIGSSSPYFSFWPFLADPELVSPHGSTTRYNHRMWLICFSSRRKAPAFCQGIFHSSPAELFWEPAVALGLILSNRQCDKHSQLLRDIWGWLEKLVFFLLKTRVCSLKVEFVVENRSFFFANGSLFPKIRVWKSYFVSKNQSFKIGVSFLKSEFENQLFVNRSLKTGVWQ